MEIFQRLALILVVNLIVYYKTLFYGWVGDDVERANRKQEFNNIIHRWWLQFISMKHINSMNAHAINIVVHAICCCMIYLALGRSNISFLAAMLFTLNPVNMQGSVWISGRNYVTASIFTLGMFLFPPLTWAFYMTSSYFAVSGWFAPLCFLGTKWWYMVGIIPIAWVLTNSNKVTIHKKLWETAGLKTTNTEMRAMKPKKLIVFLKTHLYYFVLAIFPFNLGIEHDYLRGFGTNATDNKIGYKLDKLFYIGLTLAIFMAISAIRGIVWGWQPWAWGIFWFSINIAMWCNFITIQQQIAERYLYLANIGIMYALASIIIGYPIVITAFLVGYLIRLWYVMDMYLNDYWAVEYSIMESKKMHYVWLMRGVKKWVARDHQGALYDFNEAYQHKPYDLKVLYNLAATCFVLGDVVKARDYLAKARANVYDELESEVKPAFDNLEAQIVVVEKAKAKGITQMQIDLSKVMVVK